MKTEGILKMKKLVRPQKSVNVILDTDTYNEIDDQFALAYLIKSNEKLNLLAIHSAPFLNQKSLSAKDGMEKSYNEILKVLELMNRKDLNDIVYKGSETFLINEDKPVVSDAAENLIKLAHEHSEENPLYVIAIGAITNVSSAILMDPSIKEKIVVIWLGEHAHEWYPDEDAKAIITSQSGIEYNYLQTEFNLIQDVPASKVLFDSGVPLVQLPCLGVVSAFSTTGPELEYWLKDRNELCNYLIEATIEQAQLDSQGKVWSRAIWDVAAVAWLLEEDFMNDRFVPSPSLTSDGIYLFNLNRHFIKYVYSINRDVLYEDLFKKLGDY